MVIERSGQFADAYETASDDDNATFVDGDERAYNAVIYRCIQSHTSQASWTPSAVPALWATTEKFTKARGADGLV